LRLLNIIPLFILLFGAGALIANEVTLEAKIGQMLMMGFEGKTLHSDSPIAKAIAEDNIGGVILFDYDMQSKQFDRNIESPKQVRLLNQQLQALNILSNKTHHRDPLPLFIAVDYEGGQVIRLSEKYGFPSMPSAKTIGSMSSEQVNKIARQMAQTLWSSGFNLDFAPVLDVDLNPSNLLIGKHERSFSSDPEQVALDGTIFSKQFLKRGLQCAYKHFPGHGSSMSDSHLGFVDVTDTWQKKELVPYVKLLGQKPHCGLVMTAHIVNRKLDKSGLPATLSHKILTDFLRNKLHFDGVIMTDDMQMKAITTQYTEAEAITLAINAGADMLIFGNQMGNEEPHTIIAMIKAQVDAGKISETRIDEAYQHIKTVKRKMNDGI
jgi:beta-N-acetylhexosaminidase